MQFILSKNPYSEALVVERWLGRRPYAEVWDLQRKLVEERALDKIPDTLLLVEHEHVITLGRKSAEYAAVEAQGLRELASVPLFAVERGGEATYHGPGQLVLYPIVKLSTRLGARGFLRFLEERIIELLHEYEMTTYYKEGATGVWLKDQSGEEKKIASLGIAVRHGVSYHGLALNLSTDLSYFRKINPCGFAASVMTSVATLTDRCISVEAAGQRLAELLKVQAKEWR